MLFDKLFSFLKEGQSNLPTATPAQINLPFSIPKDTMDLLWFKNGPFKNYSPEPLDITKSIHENFTITISTFGPSEPSAIDLTLPVYFSQADVLPDKLPYYPSYDGITPKQRGQYLHWLENIDSPIDIGYVFVFYYGLERHLYFGKFDQATNMILRLRENHHNSSFQSYSIDALIASSIFHKRNDILAKIAKNTSLTDADRLSPLFLVYRYYMNDDLSAGEIMSLSRQVKFTNMRYIKNDTTLFENILKGILFEKYGRNTVPLNRFSLSESPKTFAFFAANISLEKTRSAEVPNICANPKFQIEINDLLQSTHEKVKLAKKIARSKKSITQEESD